MARLASLVGWNGGGGGGGGWRERRARQRLRRRQYCGGTVWLGGRRRRPASRCRLAVSRLVRWRLVAELLRPIRKVLMEMAAAAGRRQLVALPQLSFPFVGTLALPAAVA
uniref:Uncharacterized protein n=1 Tax=Oryza meridionalis TaxID=40149 RepID=A0A0E0DJH2_9ORYZ